MFRTRGLNAARVWLYEAPGRARAHVTTSTTAICRHYKSRFARKTRATRFHCRAERLSRGSCRFSFHRSARRLGTNGMGPRFVLVSTGDNIAASRPALLGHGRLALALERKHGGDD